MSETKELLIAVSEKEREPTVATGIWHGYVSLHRAMLTPTGAVYSSPRSVYSQIIRLQLVHVSVRIDHGLRVGMVHVIHKPESGLWKVCVSVDHGLRVEVVYVSHTPHSISGKLCVRLDHGLRVGRVAPAVP